MSTNEVKATEPNTARPVAIVTGGSRGIGRGIALKLAASGYDLVVNYHANAKAAEETKIELEAAGARVVLIQADAGQEASCQAIVEATKELPGALEVLVNNAGINRDGLLVRMSEAQFDEVVSTDLKGPFLMIKAAARLMMKQRYGRIVNIASVVGIYGNAGQANYAAAKAGVIGLSKTVAKELASRNITCNVIAPGFIETDMTAALPSEIQNGILDRIALKRFGQTEEVAAAVNFLCSKEAAYITGQVLEVAGGLEM